MIGELIERRCFGKIEELGRRFRKSLYIHVLALGGPRWIKEFASLSVSPYLVIKTLKDEIRKNSRSNFLG